MRFNDATLGQGHEFIPCQLAVPENLGKQTGADDFSGVNRNSRRTTIGMDYSMMTAFDANNCEADCLQANDNFSPG